MSVTRQQISGIFYLAKAEAEDATKLQPGEHLAHIIDIQQVLNATELRIIEALDLLTEES